MHCHVRRCTFVRRVGLAVEYCQSETFEPRCSSENQVIVMKRAVFGRMSDQGRCLQPDSLLEALKHDPRYLGCSHDVLPFSHRRCSGRTECRIRIVDPELQQESPCYREMEKYMDASYTCVNGMTALHLHVCIDFTQGLYLTGVVSLKFYTLRE